MENLTLELVVLAVSGKGGAGGRGLAACQAHGVVLSFQLLEAEAGAVTRQTRRPLTLGESRTRGGFLRAWAGWAVGGGSVQGVPTFP